MDHDLLMIIFGGVIGIVSSIITTLFNTWLERHNEKRKQKEEEDKQKRKIYIPSMGEIIQMNKSDEIRHSYLSPLIMILALLCSALVIWLITFTLSDSWGSYSLDASILWLIAAGILSFILVHIMLRRLVKK